MSLLRSAIISYPLAKYKVKTSELRDELQSYGMSAFVAHEDIEPTKQWQTEIESALSTVDAMIVLMAPGFKESNWCDQEVGVAIGSQLPILAVRQGIDPYGFIGKYQALQGTGKDAKQLAKEIFDLFLPMPVIGPKITTSLVKSLSDSYSFDRSKILIGYIRNSKYLNIKHVAAMKEAVESTSQVYGSWGVPEQVSALAKQIES